MKPRNGTVFCTMFTSWVWRRHCSKNFLERACDCTFNIMKRRNNTTLKGFDVRWISLRTICILFYTLNSFSNLLPFLARIKTPAFRYTTETKCQRPVILWWKRTNLYPPRRRPENLVLVSDTIISNGLDNKRTENTLKSRRLLLSFSLSFSNVSRCSHAVKRTTSPDTIPFGRQIRGNSAVKYRDTYKTLRAQTGEWYTWNPVVGAIYVNDGSPESIEGARLLIFPAFCEHYGGIQVTYSQLFLSVPSSSFLVHQPVSAGASRSYRRFTLFPCFRPFFFRPPRVSSFLSRNPSWCADSLSLSPATRFLLHRRNNLPFPVFCPSNSRENCRVC